jgi:hypothetical protein
MRVQPREALQQRGLASERLLCGMGAKEGAAQRDDARQPLRGAVFGQSVCSDETPLAVCHQMHGCAAGGSEFVYQARGKAGWG